VRLSTRSDCKRCTIELTALDSGGDSFRLASPSIAAYGPAVSEISGAHGRRQRRVDLGNCRKLRKHATLIAASWLDFDRYRALLGLRMRIVQRGSRVAGEVR
jgi:hypothetical protein